jgi:hypothetical protein
MCCLSVIMLWHDFLNTKLNGIFVVTNAPDKVSSALGHYPLFLTAVGIKVVA